MQVSDLADSTESREDFFGDLSGGFVVGLDLARDGVVEGLALAEQVADSAQPVFHLKQRAIRVAFDSLKNHLRSGAEAEYEAGRAEVADVGGVQNDAAAGGDDEVFARGEFLYEFALEVAEIWLAGVGEDFGDGPAFALLNQRVHIHKFAVEFFRQRATGDAFAGAHEADED